MQYGVVYPHVLRRGLVTTAAMDDIYHDPTSTTATTVFHGTSMSVFQHPTRDDKREERGPLTFGRGKVKPVPELPTALPLFALLYLQARTLLPYQVVQQVQAPVCLVNVWPPNTSGWTRSVTEKTNGASKRDLFSLHASKQSS